MAAIGVDPDTHTLAIACMDGPRLAWHYVSAIPKSIVGDEAVVEVARAFDRGSHKISGTHPDVTDVVIEQMAVYPNTELGKSGIDGLMRVASTGGVALAHLMFMYPNANFRMPQPHEWKGQKKKAAHHRQIRRQIDSYTEQKLRAVTVAKRGHLLDAIGMALWAQTEGGRRNRIKRDIMGDARKAARRAKG